MTNDMGFVEGTFRIANEPWRVVIVSKADTTAPEFTAGKWASGIGGLVIRVPRNFSLNAQAVKELLASQLGVATWTEVKGPDSMQLR